MSRTSAIDDGELIARLSSVFRDVGYEGATLSALAAATGLQKASLYHRYPGGKQQMADEVLAAALAWVADNIIAPLKKDGPLDQRLAAAQRGLTAFYGAGSTSCLLNVLITPRGLGGPFDATIESAFEGLINAFTAFAHEAGASRKDARRIGMRVIALVQGSLVLARGLRDPKPFRDVIDALPHDLMPN